MSSGRISAWNRSQEIRATLDLGKEIDRASFRLYQKIGQQSMNRGQQFCILATSNGGLIHPVLLLQKLDMV